jgi:hypothetical protein
MMTNALASFISHASSPPWRMMMTTPAPLRTARASGMLRRMPATIASDHSGNDIKTEPRSARGGVPRFAIHPDIRAA